MVLLGFDKQCITPDFPIALSGYGKKRIAAEAHDDIYTRCIAFENNGVKFLIVQCDCVAIDDKFRQDVLTNLTALGISLKSTNFMLLATHTHSGPAGTLDTSTQLFQGLQYIFGEPNPNYREFLTKKISLAAKNAFSDLTPATLTIGRKTVEKVGTERHDPAKPGDTSLLTLLFERTDGKRILLYNYGCHPTVLSSENVLLTADFPYGVERDLREYFDMIVFVNSCCGDISTRFTRTSSTFEQIDIYSSIITGNIQQSLEHPIYQGPLEHLDIRQYPISLPVKKLGTVKEEMKRLEQYRQKVSEAKANGLSATEIRILESYMEGAEVSVDLARSLQGLTSLNIHFSMIHLQNLTIAVIPGELFSTLGNHLKQEGIDVFCYGNGYYLYLADKEAYDLKYYEAMTSPFERGAGESLVQEILSKKIHES